jgi:hypothetical protein
MKSRERAISQLNIREESPGLGTLVMSSSLTSAHHGDITNVILLLSTGRLREAEEPAREGGREEGREEGREGRREEGGKEGRMKGWREEEG